MKWISLGSCTPDPEVELGSVLLPEPMRDAIEGDQAWIAPKESPFFGALFDVRCGSDRAVRLSPDVAFAGDRPVSELDLVMAPPHPFFFSLESARERRDAPWFSPCLDDFLLPIGKERLLADFSAELVEIFDRHREFLICDDERYRHTAEAVARAAALAWQRTEEALPPAVLRSIDPVRARWLFTMPELRSKPDGQIQELPMLHSFGDGLTAHEYFLTAQAARRKQAEAEKIERDAAQTWIDLALAIGRVRVTRLDCETTESRRAPIGDLPLAGRTMIEDAVRTGELVARAGLLSNADLRALARAEIRRVSVRSLWTCRAVDGVCARCYGIDPTTGRMVEQNAPVGAGAARTLAELAGKTEPRVDSPWKWSRMYATWISSKRESVVRHFDLELLPAERCWLVLGAGGRLSLTSEGKVEMFDVPGGARVYVEDGAVCAAHGYVAEWNNRERLVLARTTGVARIPSSLIERAIDPITGIDRIVMKEDGAVMIGDRAHPIEAGAELKIGDRQHVEIGTVIARMPLSLARLRSSNGGFERLQRLIRREPPRWRSPIARVDGIVQSVEKHRVVIDGVPHAIDPPHDLGDFAVEVGDTASAGDALIGDLDRDYAELSNTVGPARFAEHLFQDLMEVFWPEVRIDPVHVELVVRAVLRGEITS